MGVATEQDIFMCPDILAETSDNIISSRAPSMRRIYAFKWILFTLWCRQLTLDPVHCPIGSVLEFLQSRFSEGMTPATLKVYVAAILAGHALVGDVSMGRHPLVSWFKRGEAFPSDTSSFLGPSSCLGRLVRSSFWAVGVCVNKIIDSRPLSCWPYPPSRE